MIIPDGKGPDTATAENADADVKDIDAPLLALLLRFVVSEAPGELPQEACMRLQLAMIREHVAGFPPQEREARALEWVQTHARRFRQECHGKLIRAATADDARCPDCPLSATPDRARCAMHEQWIALVRRFLDDELAPVEYVRACLDLLRAHGDEIRVELPPGGDPLH
jgi:hypothetical protein